MMLLFVSGAYSTKNLMNLVVHEQFLLPASAHHAGVTDAGAQNDYKRALQRSVDSADSYGQLEEGLAFGNASGISLLNEISEAREWRRQQDDRNRQQDQMMSRVDLNISRLNSQVEQLQKACDGLPRHQKQVLGHHKV